MTGILWRVGREDHREVDDTRGQYVYFDVVVVGDPAGKTIM